MATPISSNVKDKNSIFTAHGEDDFLVKGEILVFHQYLYNKMYVIDLLGGPHNEKMCPGALSDW